MIKSEHGAVEIKTGSEAELFADISCLAYVVMQKFDAEGRDPAEAVRMMMSAIYEAKTFFDMEKKKEEKNHGTTPC